MSGGRPPVDTDAVAELTRQGWTAPEIAAHLDCATRTITRIRRRLGIANPPPRWLTPDDLDRAEAMLADGCSVTEVERTLGYGPATLAKRFKGRGWTHQQCGQWRQLVGKVDL